MKKILGCILIIALFFSEKVMAEFEMSSFYVGGSAAINRAFEETAYGFQGFVGYDFEDNIEIADDITLAAEIGYATSGQWGATSKIDAKGIWVTGVLSIEINDELSIINRLGYTFAKFNSDQNSFFEADGIITGLGLDYNIDDEFTLRGEIVLQTYKSFQVGALYRF